MADLGPDLRAKAAEPFGPAMWDSVDRTCREHPMLELLVREALERIPGGMRAVRAAVALAAAAYQLGKGEGQLGLELSAATRESGYLGPWIPHGTSDGKPPGE